MFKQTYRNNICIIISNGITLFGILKANSIISKAFMR